MKVLRAIFELALCVALAFGLVACGGGGSGTATGSGAEADGTPNIEKAREKIPPTVISTSPVTNATGVGVNTVITVAFNEAMTASTITTATFTLKQGIANIGGTVTYNGTTFTAAFTPSINLAGGTNYTATVTTGVNDLQGNAMAANYIWSFSSWALPDTGQSTCYDSSGYVIDCAGTGQDGAYTTNPMSFADNGNGTVTDNMTGLMWQQEDDNTTRLWVDAGTYCDGLTLSGYTDWRLPDMKELMSIVNYETYGPAIDSTYFPDTDSYWYWSSSPYVDLNFAWYVRFDNGYVHVFGTDSYYARCVRGNAYPTPSFTDNGNGTVTDGNTGLMWQQEDDNTIRLWEEALTYCEGLSLAGYSDWRLPNVKELMSIVDAGVYWPAIDSTYFPNTDSYYYWSSTNYANDYYHLSAWHVYFYTGGISYGSKFGGFDGTGYARCVR